MDFGHRLIGSSLMRRMVTRAIKKISKKEADFILNHVWFVGSFDDGWAFTLRHSDLKRGEYLIFLSDELLAQDESQIIYTILHEIGHVLLGHKNSIGVVQSKAEVRMQEEEADEFVEKYIKSFYNPQKEWQKRR